MVKIKHFIQQSWLLIISSFLFGLLIAIASAAWAPRIEQNEKEKLYSRMRQLITDANDFEKAIDKIVHITDCKTSLPNQVQYISTHSVQIRLLEEAETKKMLESALAGNFQEARMLLQDMLLKQGLSGSDIIREIHRQIHRLDVAEKDKIKLIEKTGEYKYRLNEGNSDLLQLEALLAQFLLFSKK